MKEKILIPQKIAEKGRLYLLEKGYELIENIPVDSESLKYEIADCDAVLLRTAPLDAEVLHAAKKLKIVARHGAGYDNVDWKEAEKLGIYVTNTPNVTSVPVAEFTIGCIINCTKQIWSCNCEFRKGDFNYKAEHKGRELFGKKLGIIGLGSIGKEVVKRAYFGLGMQVQAFVPRPEKKEIPDYVKCISKEELFHTSDVISVHIPGGVENRHFISSEEIALMKSDAWLINVSRGGVVDEEALADAVEKGSIAGASVDVFEKEPPDCDNRLLRTPGIFVTPHMASNTVECMDRMAITAAGEIHRVLSGKLPLHAVNHPQNSGPV